MTTINPPVLKNRFTGEALKDAQLALSKAALEACRAEDWNDYPRGEMTKKLITAALRAMNEPTILTLDEYARILHLKHGIAMMHCKKALYRADGDIAKAEEMLRSGEWSRGLIF